MILKEDTTEKIISSADAAAILTKILSVEGELDREKEHFWVIGLNCHSIIRFIDLVSLGTTEQTLTDARQTFRLAVMKNVGKIIIAHNHPSGVTFPSDEDKILTKKMRECGEILGIAVLDHIIITADESKYFSFADNGEL